MILYCKGVNKNVCLTPTTFRANACAEVTILKCFIAEKYIEDLIEHKTKVLRMAPSGELFFVISSE